MLPQLPLGLPVIESRFAVTRSTKELPRSWKERLFSLPWRPWVATREVTREEPAIFRIGNKIIVHPELMAALRETFAEPREDFSDLVESGGDS